MTRPSPPPSALALILARSDHLGEPVGMSGKRVRYAVWRELRAQVDEAGRSIYSHAQIASWYGVPRTTISSAIARLDEVDRRAEKG